ncbi:hypothetical protein GCM10007301_18070 [Azorhizobium oxalatiphilum]|uniref:DUF7939 domain-containing protein n=1 Tax=Azorhizobium oxalatiphilum TaxID=980631 RepID=A0A917F9P3_9HYPH|nr:BatD family protein [Azorhizobium oxalatiphilum]GGF58756.1 hypothetical protein GCM10007301_18070 [Azorhizobium oxalatiphilum]
MRRFLVLLFVLLAAPLGAQQISAPSQTPQVIVRESLSPASGAVVGQHVALRVDVLFADEMPRPPRVSLPEVPGLQVLRFETQGTGLRETIDGRAYVGQRFEFALYARRGGAFDIAPAAVTLLDRAGAITGTAEGQTVPLRITVPPGVDPSGAVVATRTLTLTQSWQPSPAGHFKAGDAVVRIITRTAEDIPGLAMRDVAFEAPEGVRVYADPPDISDRSNRGVVTGQRVDRVTYVFERGGTVNLPSLTQPWWDLSSGTLKHADAGGTRVEVASVEVPAVDARQPSVRLAVVVVLAVLLVGGAGVLLLRRTRSRQADERMAFEAVRRACTEGDAHAVYRALCTWRPWLSSEPRQQVRTATADLDRALFASPPADWRPDQSRALLRRLEDVRRPPATAAQVAVLPPLNPRST